MNNILEDFDVADIIRKQGEIERRLDVLSQTFRVVGETNQPAFANSWVNHSSTYNSAGFYRDVLERVWLRGFIKSGTIGQTAFILPDGYRPQKTEVLQAISDNGAATLVSYVSIDTAGLVKPAIGANGWFSLDGLSFKL